MGRFGLPGGEEENVTRGEWALMAGILIGGACLALWRADRAMRRELGRRGIDPAFAYASLDSARELREALRESDLLGAPR